MIAAAAFIVRYTVHTLKGYTPVQLVFGRDMVLLIIYISNWELIPQHNQANINYDNVRENKFRGDHNYQVVDIVMLRYWVEHGDRKSVVFNPII